MRKHFLIGCLIVLAMLLLPRCTIALAATPAPYDAGVNLAAVTPTTTTVVAVTRGSPTGTVVDNNFNDYQRAHGSWAGSAATQWRNLPLLFDNVAVMDTCTNLLNSDGNTMTHPKTWATTTVLRPGLGSDKIISMTMMPTVIAT